MEERRNIIFFTYSNLESFEFLLPDGSKKKVKFGRPDKLNFLWKFENPYYIAFDNVAIYWFKKHTAIPTILFGKTICLQDVCEAFGISSATYNFKVEELKQLWEEIAEKLK